MIFILTDAAISLGVFTAEFNYCKAVCKSAVPQLTDADFDTRAVADIFNLGYSYNLQYVYNRNNNKDIIIVPTSSLSSQIGTNGWNYYPRLNIVMPFARSGLVINGASLPETLNLSPNRLPMIMSVGGGNSGLSDWYNGAGLEFVEPAVGMYLNGENLITSFAITNITSPGGGLTRIYASEFTNDWFHALKWKCHITAVAGFSNNPNGSFNIVGRDATAGYIEITHDVGTGSWTNGTGVVKINYMSGAVSSAGAKIYYIAKQRNCNIFQARKCAQVTGSQSGTRDDTHGFGLINTSAAIAYEGTIGADPYDTMGAVGTLAINIADGEATFTHAEITNAKKIRLYRNDIALSEHNLTYGGSFSYLLSSLKLKLQEYKIKGLRDKQQTALSNGVTTNIDSLTGMPLPTKLNEGDTAYYIKGGKLLNSEITEIIVNVTNPNYDNVGAQTNEYRLSNGDIIKENPAVETKIFFTERHYLWSLLGGGYLNNFEIPVFTESFEYPLGDDLCGFNFYVTDFVANGELDFSGKYVIGCNFAGATLPAAVEDKADFKAAVAAYDPVSTIWTDGLPIGE